MKAIKTVLLLLLFAGSTRAQTQIKIVPPTTTSLTFNWDFDVALEPQIDDFVLQSTPFATTSVISGSYSVESLISARASRSYVFTMPVTTAGQKAFFRIISRKSDVPDSAPSNVVEVDVQAASTSLPAPSNVTIQ